MPRENGGVVGVNNFTTQNYARGVFNLKTHFNSNISSLWPRSGSLFLAVAHATTPFISVYPFSSLGFGAKLSNPSTLPTGAGNDVAFTTDGMTMAVVHDTSPYVSVYPFSGSGIGTKYSDPGTAIPSIGNGVAFNPSGNAIAIAHLLSPFVTAYPWSAGFGSKYSNPTTIPASSGQTVQFSPNGNDIAVGHTSAPFLSVYPWSSGFGSKYADHPSNYTASVNSIVALKFHPSGNFINVGFVSSGSLTNTRIERTYSFTSGTGFNAGYFDTTSSATKLSAASTEGSDIYSLDYNPAGTDVAFGTNGNVPYSRSFAFNTSTGYTSQYTDPATDTTGKPVNGTEFSPDGNYLAQAHNTTPFVTVWPWTTGTGYGTKITNPVTLPASTGNGIAWNRV